VTAPPLELARRAAHVCGGHGKGRIAAGVGIVGRGSACWGGGGHGGRPLVTGPPPAFARLAAGVSGGEGCWCVAAGVGIAGGGSACWGGGGHWGVHL